MKAITIIIITVLLIHENYAQIVPADPKPHLESETSKSGQVAIKGFSGPIGEIVPLPTDPKSIGVWGVGFTGMKGEGKGVGGYGVHGRATNPDGRGV